MVAKKTINRNDIAREVHKRLPEFLMRDINKVLEEAEVVVSDEVDKGNKVKLGKLIELEIQMKKARRHYDGIDKIHGGSGKYVEIPARRRVKYTPMKLLKDIQNKDIK